METLIIAILFIASSISVTFSIAAPMLKTEITDKSCSQDVKDVKKNLMFLRFSPIVYSVILVVLFILMLL